MKPGTTIWPASPAFEVVAAGAGADEEAPPEPEPPVVDDPPEPPVVDEASCNVCQSCLGIVAMIVSYSCGDRFARSISGRGNVTTRSYTACTACAVSTGCAVTARAASS